MDVEFLGKLIERQSLVLSRMVGDHVARTLQHRWPFWPDPEMTMPHDAEAPFCASRQPIHRLAKGIGSGQGQS